jgi:hypothetical protein
MTQYVCHSNRAYGCVELAGEAADGQSIMATREPSAAQPQSKERDLQAPSAMGEVLEYRKRSDFLTVKRRERRAPSRIRADITDHDELRREVRNDETALSRFLRIFGGQFRCVDGRSSLGFNGESSRRVWTLGRAVALSVLFYLAPSRAGEVSFRNDVMAVLSKAGCNAGGCHGNANGKAGFKLSLRGEDPDFDFDALTREQFGRRTNPLDPDQSLILLKPAAEIAHEGGKRFTKDSVEYRMLRQWIAAGARSDSPDTPKLTRIEVTPVEKILVEPEQTVQLRVRAKFSDGSERDISHAAVYDTANTLATVSPDGLVKREGLGETTILVRYLNRQVPVSLAFVPARPDFTWSRAPVQNYVDEHVFAKLLTLRMNPSELCNDETFIRRAYLDLLGFLPPAESARAFVEDPRSDKRARLIDQLLQRPEFADAWALKWSDLLRNEERGLDQKGVQSFHGWIRQSIAEGKPMDQFVRELIAARGSTYANPAANFYRANRDPITRAVATAQVFLGTRLQCAQCHNHPFDRWTQDDYYSWAAVFSKVQYKVLENRRQDPNDQHEFKGEQIVYVARAGDVKNPRTGKPAEPHFLGATAVDGKGASPNNSRAADQDELEALAVWMTSPDNTFFARSQANRIWFHLMGRGIVDPIDDFRATNPASHPALLEALAQDFVTHGFDLRHLIRVIMNSRAYQLSSVPNETNREDEMNYSHTVVRRLSAEQMLDCGNQVLAVTPKFQGYPAGFRATQLPGARPEKVRGRRGATGGSDQFLELFGKPPRLLTCECERSSETTMNQAFQMISGPTVNDLLTNSDNRLAQLLASGRSNREIVEEMYWTALTRAPAAAEMAKAVSYLENAKERRLALEDIVWGLLNAKEFVLRK